MSEDPVGLGDRTRSIENIGGDRQYFQRPPCVERWLRHKAQLTRKKYLGYLVRFQLLTGLASEQLLQWCKTVEPVDVQDLIDKTSMEFKPAIQFCYRVAIRSFLSHNGCILPKTNLQYVSEQWHRGYKRAEIQALLGCLRQKLHRLFLVMGAESGLRSHVLMQLNYCHIKEDFEAGRTPVAIRLEPRFYVGKKAAGYTFLGDGSVRLIRECLNSHLIEETLESKLVPRSYYRVWASIRRAKKKLDLDPKIQTCHGLRKYFENALDDANIDHERKMLIEGHFAGTRAKHYTDRDIEQLRDIYRRAYPFIRLNLDDPAQVNFENDAYTRTLADVEARLGRLNVLEAKLKVLEDEMHQMKHLRRELG